VAMSQHLRDAETGMAEVNGTRLYYEVRGEGTPLVFLHGFTLDHRMWNRQVDELAKRHRVVTYDARGFGRSALPGVEPYMHCEDAAALCGHLGLRRVVVIGHSIGAHQMLELAFLRPDLVAGLVSIGMAGLAGVPFPEDVTKMFGAVRQAAGERSIDAAKSIWKNVGWFTPARDNATLAAELDQMLEDYSGWHWTHDNPAKGVEPPVGVRLEELRVPAMIITGLRDLPYNQAIREVLVGRLGSVSELRLPHASHMANMEDPVAVNHAIAAFARRTASAAG
jgi:3-oxoadipate enol-lactonase